MEASAPALRACMIDGLGPFEEADYRRSWLFFEDVDYVLPHRLADSFALAELGDHPEFAVCRPALAAGAIEHILEATCRDGEDAELKHVIATRFPLRDREYAAALVWSDVELRQHLTRHRAIDPVLYLANKLLWYAAHGGAIPIVGRDYAAELIARKLRLAHARLGRSLVSARGGSAFAAFTAGLALDFLPDEQLVAAPIARLVEFKQRHRTLLAQHQLHLVEVAEAFAGLPDGADFDARLAELRLQARRDRLDLDGRARDAWADLGFDLARKAVAAATAGLFSGLAVLRGHTLGDVLTAAVPAAVAAGGAVLGSVVELRAKQRGKPAPAMAYLFRASQAIDT